MEPDQCGIFPILFIRMLVVMLKGMCDRHPGAPHLLQSPVELCWPEGVQLNKVSPQQKHQTTVVHVQGVMMPVHLCKKAEHREGLLYMHYVSLGHRTNNY